MKSLHFFRLFFIRKPVINGHRTVQSVVSFLWVILTLSIITSVKRNISVSDVSNSDEEVIQIIIRIICKILLIR